MVHLVWWCGIQKGQDHEKHLDMLLSKLQGPAGDYVFDELSLEVFIKCLKHRFWKMESAKTYATMFWKRDQRASETEEAYAIELKCTYGKVYPLCDCSAWDENLLHKFLNGFLDQKAQQQIKFVKDPANIDDALDEVVKYGETHQLGNSTEEGIGWHHARTADMNTVQTETSDAQYNSKDEANSWFTWANKPLNKVKEGQQNDPEEKPKNGEMGGL